MISTGQTTIKGVQETDIFSFFISFLHAKLYGEHNHLVGDPWSRTDAVYWISGTGHVYRLTRAGSGRVDLMWTPGHVSRGESNSGDKYNKKL